MKKKRALVLLGALLFTGGLFGWHIRWCDEEYSVYDSVISEIFSGDQVSSYVILDTTEPIDRIGISGFHSRKLGLASDTRFSYNLRNILRFRIAPRLRLTHSYRLVSETELASLYSPARKTSPESDELRELIQRSWGVITLSRVGFDYRKRHAVVYAQLTYCGLCGEGMYLYLSKETGVWHVIGRAGTWIS